MYHEVSCAPVTLLKQCTEAGCLGADNETLDRKHLLPSKTRGGLQDNEC